MQKGDDVVTELHYDSDLFCNEDIRRLSEQFHTLLTSAISSPEALIDDLEILSKGQQNSYWFSFSLMRPKLAACPVGINMLNRSFCRTRCRAQTQAFPIKSLTITVQAVRPPAMSNCHPPLVSSSPPTKPCTSRLEDQADRTPDRVAVVFGDND